MGRRNGFEEEVASGALVGETVLLTDGAAQSAALMGALMALL